MMVPATTKHLILNPGRGSEEPVADLAHEERNCDATTPQGILAQHLRELDHEWNAERVTAVCSGLALLGGVALVMLLGEGWLALPALIGAWLLLHGLVRRTPGLGLMSCLGFRSQMRIAQEHWTMQARGGDFEIGGLDVTAQDREDLSRFENEGGAAAPPTDTSGLGSTLDRVRLPNR